MYVRGHIHAVRVTPAPPLAPVAKEPPSRDSGSYRRRARLSENRDMPAGLEAAFRDVVHCIDALESSSSTISADARVVPGSALGVFVCARVSRLRTAETPWPAQSPYVHGPNGAFSIIRLPRLVPSEALAPATSQARQPVALASPPPTCRRAGRLVTFADHLPTSRGLAHPCPTGEGVPARADRQGVVVVSLSRVSLFCMRGRCLSLVHHPCRQARHRASAAITFCATGG